MAIKYRNEQRAKKKFQSPGHYTKADREKIDATDFGDPHNKKFPIVTQQDVQEPPASSAMRMTPPT